MSARNNNDSDIPIISVAFEEAEKIVKAEYDKLRKQIERQSNELETQTQKIQDLQMELEEAQTMMTKQNEEFRKQLSEQESQVQKVQKLLDDEREDNASTKVQLDMAMGDAKNTKEMVLSN